MNSDPPMMVGRDDCKSPGPRIVELAPGFNPEGRSPLSGMPGKRGINGEAETPIPDKLSGPRLIIGGGAGAGWAGLGIRSVKSGPRLMGSFSPPKAGGGPRLLGRKLF